MRYHNVFCLVMVITLIAGCQTVHTNNSNTLPIAGWPLEAESTTQPTGSTSHTEHSLVETVLREGGLHPTIDQGGVVVPDQEENRARELLLTDKRLTDSHLIVFVVVPAGAASRTAAGIDIPASVLDNPPGLGQ